MNKKIRRILIGVGVVIVILPVARVIFYLTYRPTPEMPIDTVDFGKATIPSSLAEIRGLLDVGEKAKAIRILEETVSSEDNSQKAYESTVLLADIYKDDKNLIRAKELYDSAINKYSDYCDYADIQKKMNSVNMAILFSKIPTSDSEMYKIVPGDSLVKIAERYSTTVELIKRANGLESDMIRPEQILKIQKGTFSIIVDKSQSTLSLLANNDEVIKTYIVSTGKNNSTPVGTFKIKDKLIDPPWYSPKGLIPANDPDNILGTRWMGITTNEPGYGIHGTTLPESIGYQSTDGCVRMINSDVEELFSVVPIKTEVTIID